MKPLQFTPTKSTKFNVSKISNITEDMAKPETEYTVRI